MVPESSGMVSASAGSGKVQVMCLKVPKCLWKVSEGSG